jgi:hypothetical protein
MSALSDFLENKVLDQLFGATAYTAPSTLYFALFTSAPTDVAGSGLEVPAAHGYTRAAVTNNSSNWSAAASGSKTNSAQITFSPGATTGGWGNVVAVGIFDAQTSGNLLFWTTIPSRAVVAGDVPRFAAGGVTVTLN